MGVSFLQGFTVLLQWQTHRTLGSADVLCAGSVRGDEAALVHSTFPGGALKPESCCSSETSRPLATPSNYLMRVHRIQNLTRMKPATDLHWEKAAESRRPQHQNQRPGQHVSSPRTGNHWNDLQPPTHKTAQRRGYAEPCIRPAGKAKAKHAPQRHHGIGCYNARKPSSGGTRTRRTARRLGSRQRLPSST